MFGCMIRARSNGPPIPRLPANYILYKLTFDDFDRAADDLVTIHLLLHWRSVNIFISFPG